MLSTNFWDRPRTDLQFSDYNVQYERDIRIHTYNTTSWLLFRHVVCNVPVCCKANGVGNQLGRGDTVTSKSYYCNFFVK